VNFFQSIKLFKVNHYVSAEFELKLKSSNGMVDILKINSDREKTLKLLKETPKENGKEINSLLLL